MKTREEQQKLKEQQHRKRIKKAMSSSSSSSSQSSFLQSAESPVISNEDSFCCVGTSTTKSKVVKETKNSSVSNATPNLTPLHHSASERKVMYFIDNSVTSISFAERHFMRPSRVRVLHSLIHSLGLDARMQIAIAPPASESEMCIFHRRAYVECLRSAPCICADPLVASALSFQQEFDVPVGSVRGDCPLFPEIWELVCSQAGGSLACARAILTQQAHIAINWAGGMHHAAAAHASGFCYINDAVLCIKHLLQKFQRVLYVDLDVHHGDGVESAFYGNPRVMTCSLHQYGDKFFPGTGNYASTGSSETMNSFAINVPLPARTGDEAYVASFQLVLSSILQCYDPEVLVVQCGADTIAGDLIGRLCLSTVAHAHCVQRLLQLQLPIILLGGGGYHVFHTAQCWAISTACACGLTLEQLPLYIPECDVYYKYYRAESCPLRPRLHVLMDKDVDHALSLAESQVHWRKLCVSLPCQLHSARCLREKFTRMVRSLVLSHKRTRECISTNTKALHFTEKHKIQFNHDEQSLCNVRKVVEEIMTRQDDEIEERKSDRQEEKGEEVLKEKDDNNNSPSNCNDDINNDDEKSEM